MNNFYAPLRALEQKFITYTAELGPGPGKPVLVLCPSARVAAHLQKQLCQEKGVVSNIYFKTFSQLLEELDQENVQQTDPLLPGNRLHEFLLKTLLSRPGLNLYRQSPGFLTALRTSLRDMADSLADPEILKEYVQNCQEPFLLQEQQHLLWLISVYQQYLNQMNKVKGFRSYQVFFNQALAQAEHSAYLQSFHQIVVYGFYELTGRQLELFNALRAHYSVSVFWAYDSHAAFAFGKKFFDTNVLGSSSAQKVTGVNVPIAAQEAVDCLFTAEQAQTRPSQMHLFSAADIEGELFYVAKEILRLHEQEGIAFEDIAITARSLEGYKTLLPEVMRQNFIALNTSFSFGLLSQPLGVMIYNLLSLVRTGFERSSLLAVVTSPYFKHKKQWRYLIEQCLAQRDFAQWKDLLRPTLKNYDSDFMAWLQECRACLEFLEHSHKWATLQETLLTFLEENVDTSVFTAQEKTLWEQVKHIIHNFSRYEFIEEYAGEKEFLDEFFASFLQEQTHQVYDEPNGVSVADVMNLRGLHFKVLFVLGMNEKVFPQIIREDPVLKDYFRRIMRDQLGYWINQKMERFDEERLLFYTTLQAAEKEIYVSFLRSDAEGKPLVPSMYLVELARAARMNLQSEDVLRISAHLPQRLKQVDSRLLTQQEMSLLIALQPRPQEPYTRAGLLDDAKQKSISAAKALSVLGAMGPYDGVVQSGEEIFTLCNEKKFSPSSLRDLATCPMKYFFSKAVGLKEKDEVCSRSEWAYNERGNAYHAILMDYYERLYKDGLSGQLFESALQERVLASVDKYYQPKSYQSFGIYPVIWDMILQDLKESLAEFVTKDAKKLENFIPSIFETEFEKNYEINPQLKIKLKGIIDRIDLDVKSKTFRVLDYKSSKHGGKDLAVEMFKRVILQPFIYLILAQDDPKMRGCLPDGAALLNIKDGNKIYARQELSPDAFLTLRPRVNDFLALLMSFLKKGHFFINPSDFCQYCPYTAICRKDSFRTFIRVRNEADFHKLEESKQ